ncbi:RHS repeat domain-containing protein [Streptomyces sp. NPDC091387]|uniref:RHS repeat domain-containing protein n=1 Tax=Streptomyces sp. NPDC091387 TaxID=3365998 RepID=UPI0037FB38AD
MARARDTTGRTLGDSYTVAGHHTPLWERAYSRRPDGHLTGIDDSIIGPRRHTLTASGRVTRIKGDNWTESYAYDQAGNQTQGNWPSSHAYAEATGERTYAGTRIQSAGRIRYEHDAAGRTTLRQKTRLSAKPDTWHYTWDTENRLTQVATPDGTTWRYRYDPLGRRVAKQRLGTEGMVAEETRFTWHGPTLIEQSAASASWSGVETFTWEHDEAGLTPLAQTRRYRSTTDAPPSETDARFYAIITDLIGSPALLVDEAGETAWEQRSTLWGTTTWSPEATAYTPLRFPGQYHDLETGHHYNVHRYYDPETARYLSPDPLGLAPCPNPLAYVANPQACTDPLGLSPCVPSTAVQPGQRAAADRVHIFRNVDAREFDAIASTNQFGTGFGQMEGKWFATQGAHADRWGELLNGGDGLTVTTGLPRSLADKLHFHAGKLDGVGPGYYADGDQLAQINKMMDGIRLWP